MTAATTCSAMAGNIGCVVLFMDRNSCSQMCIRDSINNKQNLAGAEIGGIKMHAAIDVIFRRNHIPVSYTHLTTVFSRPYFSYTFSSMAAWDTKVRQASFLAFP